MPLSVGIINLVAAPDRKDHRCLTVYVRWYVRWSARGVQSLVNKFENVEVSSLSYW